MREKTFMVVAFVVGGALLYGGRDLLPSSVLGTWLLTFGGTTALALLMVSVYRLQLELKASRHALARNEAEISFALQVQKALFPRELPTCGGLEFSAVCIPARGISGDYYDILNLSGDRLAFAIADISGKGIPAAILMANLQALLRTLADNHESPQEMCSRLNSHLHRVTESSRFATFFYAEYNAGTRHIRYVNAGHNPPILLGSRNGQTLDCGGFPLGLFGDSEYEMGEFDLQPGDLMLLYSDGITESGAYEGEEFGEERLAKILQGQQDEPLEKIQAEVLNAVQQWSGREPDDDMTMVLVRTCEREQS